MSDITDYTSDWCGVQTVENTPAIADRLRHMLTGKRYTFTTAVGGYRSPMLDVHTDQRLNEDGMISSWEDHDHPTEYAGFYVLGMENTQSWGKSTRNKSEKFDPQYNEPFWTFSANQARVQQQESGHLEVWAIAVQEEDDEQG